MHCDGAPAATPGDFSTLVARCAFRETLGRDSAGRRSHSKYSCEAALKNSITTMPGGGAGMVPTAQLADDQETMPQ